MYESSLPRARLGVAVMAARGLADPFAAPQAQYGMICFGADGNIKWHDGFSNIVVTAGKNDLLTKYFKGSTYTAAWSIGLIDNAAFVAVAAADTMSTHPGWVESIAYANAVRPDLILGSASSGSIDNSAAPASFAINSTATIRGAFISSNNAKGGGTGTLYSAGTFAASRSVSPGDTLNITVTLSAS